VILLRVIKHRHARHLPAAYPFQQRVKIPLVFDVVLLIGQVVANDTDGVAIDCLWIGLIGFPFQDTFLNLAMAVSVSNRSPCALSMK
jgi:hypothetical protein